MVKGGRLKMDIPKLDKINYEDFENTVLTFIKEKANEYVKSGYITEEQRDQIIEYEKQLVLKERALRHQFKQG